MNTLSPNLKQSFNLLKISWYFFLPYPANSLKQVICTCDSSESGFFSLKTSAAYSLKATQDTPFLSPPVSVSPGDLSTFWVWAVELHLHLASTSVSPSYIRAPDALIQSCLSLHPTSSSVSSRLWKLSLLCTCPLVMSTWTRHRSLITSQMESSFIHCYLSHVADFHPGHSWHCRDVAPWS